MLDILTIKSLTPEDAPIFGKENVLLGNLHRNGFSVAEGFVVTPPILKLHSLLSYYNLHHKELFEQTLVLVKKSLEKEPLPEELLKKISTKDKFYFDEKVFSSIQEVWHRLLSVWLEEIKQRLWLEGFSPDLAKNLSPQTINYVNKVSSFGDAFFDEINDDVVLNVKQGSLTPVQQKTLHDMCISANKKLIIPHVYSWVLDQEIKVTSLNLYTPSDDHLIIKKEPHQIISIATPEAKKCVTKVILDLSTGFVIEKNVDGIFIASENVFNPQKQETFDELVFKLIESSKTLPEAAILLKLADMPETARGVRGALRLLHQKSLLDPLIKALVFCREDKHLKNIHVVIPFVRHINEFENLKQLLSEKKLSRNHLMNIWLEICVVENILNLDEYLSSGLDGVVININELISSIYGVDQTQEQLGYFKKEIKGLKTLLETPLKKLHKEKIPVLVNGSAALDPILLEFLLELGVTGIIGPRYEVASIQDLLYRIEKKIVLLRARS